MAKEIDNSRICVYKSRFRYEPCRSCDGLDKECKNFRTEKPRRYITYSRYNMIRRANDRGVLWYFYFGSY